MYSKEALIERLQDEEYSKTISELIDQFFELGKGVTVADVVKDQMSQDMVEVIMEHAADYKDKGMTVVVGFMLGVWLAHKDLAILPSQLN